MTSFVRDITGIMVNKWKYSSCTERIHSCLSWQDNHSTGQIIYPSRSPTIHWLTDVAVDPKQDIFLSKIQPMQCARRNQLDDAWDVGDLMKEIKLSFIEAQSRASHRLLDQLKLLADLLWKIQRWNVSKNATTAHSFWRKNKTLLKRQWS